MTDDWDAINEETQAFLNDEETPVTTKKPLNNTYEDEYTVNQDQLKELDEANDNDLLAAAGNATINVQRTEKPHSYSWRYGGAGTDCKVYYETPEQLAQHFENLADVQERIADAVQRIKAANNKEDKEE